jgi:hypothetical protein
LMFNSFLRWSCFLWAKFPLIVFFWHTFPKMAIMLHIETSSKLLRNWKQRVKFGFQWAMRLVDNLREKRWGTYWGQIKLNFILIYKCVHIVELVNGFNLKSCDFDV